MTRRRSPALRASGRFECALALTSMLAVGCGGATAPTPSPAEASQTETPAVADAEEGDAVTSDTSSRDDVESGVVRAGVEDLVRVRCATDGSDVYTTWTGSVSSWIPGERQRKLFDVVGMNVARCFQDDEGTWRMTTREAMLYLDPETGEVLREWQNPWTDETVPVVHVANSPVQMPLGGPVPMHVTGDLATFALDIPLFYPNALAAAEETRPYSPEPSYQAGEYFALTARRSAAQDDERATVPELAIRWLRVGPWLPWMKMGEAPGRLVYASQGHKVGSYEELPEVLRDEIDARIPTYRRAPECWLDERNETSWSYFQRHREAYEQGAQFPVMEREGEERCAEE